MERCASPLQDEVFDVVADPFETENLFNDTAYAGVVAALQFTLEAWRDLALPVEEYPSLLNATQDILEAS